jgi:hypothetical protein
MEGGRAIGAPAARPMRQLALLWGGVAVALLALALAAPRIAALPLACPFRALTSHPCPACGSLRAALALARLDPAGAVRANPLAAVAWAAVVGGGLIAGAAALRGRELREPPSTLSRRARAAIVALILLNWAYLLATHA